MAGRERWRSRGGRIRPFAIALIAMTAAGTLAAQEAPRDEAPPVRRELARILRDQGEIRIRDLSRSNPLGLERTERLLAAVDRAAARLAADPANAEAEPSSPVLAERLWEEPAWTDAAAEVLTAKEQQELELRRRARLAAAYQAAGQFAAALLAAELQLSPERTDGLLRLADLRGDLIAVETPAERMVRSRKWAAAAASGLSSAQRRRLAFGDGAPAVAGAGGERAILVADLEVWVADAGARGQLSEAVRGLLFDCGRRAILVAMAETGSPSHPLDDPILRKALATHGGVELAATMDEERQARRSAISARWREWVVAELDVRLCLTEAQRGAVSLVLGSGTQRGALDPFPIAAALSTIPPSIRGGLPTILEAAQSRVLGVLLEAGDEP